MTKYTFRIIQHQVTLVAQTVLILMAICCGTNKRTDDGVAVDLLNPLFKNGESGYACFRIPAVVKATDGSLVAICEARKNGCSDTGDIDLVMKNSIDNGITWSDLKIIWDDNTNVCGNPAPVVDETTGNLYLLATWNNGEDHESEIIEGTSIDGREIFLLVSKDHGSSWSAPENISKDVKLPNWTWYATGPVHGIQLKTRAYKDRLVIPCDHIEKESKKYYSHVIFSDDHGKSWQLGGTTPNHQVNECTVAELDNGDLILNMRNYARNDSQTRQVAISKDGGINWIDQRFDPQLPEPRCQGALLATSYNNKSYLLFTNPAHEESRLNMTLSVSNDQGISWSKKISIFQGPAAYSDLAQLSNGDLLVLFEAGDESPYEGIYYQQFASKDLF